MIDWLIDPFSSPFTQRAAMMCVFIGILAPVVGTWIVLRKLSYLGDAMSHATVGGVAVAYWAAGTASVLIGALAAGAVMAGALVVLSLNRRLASDAIIGVVEAGMFSAGILIISRLDSGVELSHFLFGQVLATTTGDVWFAAILTVAVVAIIIFLFDDLRMTSFDEMHAQQVGIRVRAVQFVLLLLLAVAVVVCLRTVGTLLSVSLAIVPAATARLVTNSVKTMTFVGAGAGVSSTLGGFIIAYHADASPGATIALTATCIFVVVYVVTLPRRQRHHPRPAI